MTKKTKNAKPMSELDEALLKEAKRARHSDELNAHVQKHRCIYDDIKHLTSSRLNEDLKAAKKYEHGYFKNDKGVYIYVKGFEVDGTCNLLRGGYNAEDHGVYVHYAYVDEHTCSTRDIPMCAFESLFSQWQDKADRFYRTSKECFDNAVKTFVDKVTEPYKERHSIKEYIDFIRVYDKHSIAIVKADIELLELQKQRNAGDEDKLKTIQRLIDRLKKLHSIDMHESIE